MQGKISVVMATYNGGKFIKQQLDSIISQLPKNSEIIISDDSSTDATISIIRQYQDPRIILHENKRGKGAKNNFENALTHATGDIIFLSDQDDIWHNDKVSTSLKYLLDYDMIVSDCEIIDEKNNIIINSYFDRRKSGRGIFKNLWANTYLGCCMVFNKKVLTTSLPFPQDIPMHDIWLGFISEMFYKSIFLKNGLVSYRMHEQNISPTTVGISPHNLLSRFIFRWNIIKYFPLLIYRKWIQGR